VTTFQADVLICDDEVGILDAITDSLTHEGLTVEAVESGEAVLKRMDTGQYRVLLLDLLMPDLDGIATAYAVQERHQHVSILFVTGNDSELYRLRAAQHKLRVYRWIDKHPDYVKEVAAAVTDALSQAVHVEVTRRLAEGIAEAGLSPEQAAVLGQRVLAQPLLVPAGLKAWRKIYERVESQQLTLGLADLLHRLSVFIEEVAIGYHDPAHREVPWNRLRDLVRENLWSSLRAEAPDKYRLQVALQLEVAIGKIDATVLTGKHVDAARLCIDRLRNANVMEADVVACKEAWRTTGIDTLPSFAEIIKDWQRYYAHEGPDDDE